MGLNTFLADPAVFVWGGKYYLYGTVEGSSAGGFKVYSSEDMQHWKLSGEALRKGESFGSTGFWAPQVFRMGSTFYMAYVANENIAIATGKSPLGPFRQQALKPLEAPVRQIDPYVFTDADGRKYLYHVRLTEGNRIFVAELKTDLSGIIESTLRECITAEAGWENTANAKWPVAEGPSVFKHNGVYYLFYTANDFRNPDYAVGYATSKSPLGPWKKYSENPVISRKELGINGTGHGDFFMKGAEMYYVLHTHFDQHRTGPRRTAVVKMRFVKKGGEPDAVEWVPGSLQFLKPKVDYAAELNGLRAAIQSNFYVADKGYYKETAEVEAGKNPYSYLWPLCALIQAANEMETVTKKKGALREVLSIVKRYYDPAPPAPGYASYTLEFGGGDRFYDDNQWIGIACMDAYKRDPRPEYLDIGTEIYRYMMTGFDTVFGGGLYWQENKKISKNTCSNGPAILLAMQLHGATGNRSYLDTAVLLYDWVNLHLKAPNGLYYDNVSVPGARIDKAMYSYNTGTMLQSALYLYEATKDRKYLAEATAIADSSARYFYGSGRFRDSYWFNAVLLRGYQHLLRHNKDRKYLDAFETCLVNALSRDKDGRGLMGREKTLDLVAQGGMLEILARFAYLKQ